MYYISPVVDSTSPSSYFANRALAGRTASTPRQYRERPISIRLSDVLLSRLGRVGDREGLGLSDTIRLVLERGLAASKE